MKCQESILGKSNQSTTHPKYHWSDSMEADLASCKPFVARNRTELRGVTLDGIGICIEYFGSPEFQSFACISIQGYKLHDYNS